MMQIQTTVSTMLAIHNGIGKTHVKKEAKPLSKSEIVLVDTPMVPPACLVPPHVGYNMMTR